MRSGLADRLGSLLCQPGFNELFEFFGSPDDRAITSRAKKIVSDPVASREDGISGVIRFGVERLDGGNGWRVLYIEVLARQMFIKKPGPPCQRAGRC